MNAEEIFELGLEADSGQVAEVEFSSLTSCSFKDSLLATGHIILLPLSLLRTC